MSFDAQRYRATQHQQWELAATGWSKWQSFYEEHSHLRQRTQSGRFLITERLLF